MDPISIVGQISPKFCLRPFRGIISWIDLINVENEGFTKDKLLEHIQKVIDKRSRESELKAVPLVLDLLLKAGLISKSNSKFMCVADFRVFKELLEQFSSSSTRLVAWTIHFLGTRQRASIAIKQIIETVSFDEDEIKDAVPHLSVWKEKIQGDSSTSFRSSLLRQSGECWEILEIPHVPCTPIILGDLNSRLHAAAAKILSKKRIFSLDELIAHLRELEDTCVRSAIKKLGLKVENGAIGIEEGFTIEPWIRNETERIPIRTIKHPTGLKYIRVEGGDLYDGDPFRLIMLGLGEIFECDRFSSSAADFKNRCKSILERWNSELSHFGFELRLQRAMPFGLPPGEHYAIRFKRHPKPELKGSMMERYNAIQFCRIPESRAVSIWSKLSSYQRPQEDDLIAYLAEKRKRYSHDLSAGYSEIIRFLNWWKKELEELARRDEVNQGTFIISSGFGEIANIFISSFIQAYNGFFRSAFMLLRDAIEWLSLTVFLDCIRMKYKHSELGPLRDIYHELIQTVDWHKALEGLYPSIGLIKTPDELKRGIETRLFEPNRTEIEARGIRRKTFVEEVIKHLSLPLFISSTGTVRCPTHAGDSKYALKFKDFQEYLGLELVRVMALFAEGKDFRPWVRSDDWDALTEKYTGVSFAVATNCSHRINDKTTCGAEADSESVFIVKLPTTNVLIYLMGKRLSLPDTMVKQILGDYNDYCCVVHPYPQTMQYSPFTSGDEVNLWVNELKGLLRLMSQVLCRLVVYLRSDHDESIFNDPEQICGKCYYFSSKFDSLNPDIIRRKRWRARNYQEAVFSTQL